MADAIYWALPKTDLHLHLDGAVRPDTLRDLAALQGIDSDAVEANMRVKASGSLESYLEHFAFVLPLLQTRESLIRVASEIVEDAAMGQAAYIEVRFCPLLHMDQGMTGETIVDAVLEGLTAGNVNAVARVILCSLQGMNEDQANRIVDLALAFRSAGVVAVDVAGDETGKFNLAPFVRPYQRARDGGLKVTCHAGEGGPVGNILEAIEKLGASRIGHGTAIFDDPRAVELAVERNIGIECCITSNVQTGAIASLADHPLRRMIAAGLSATINTDNPTLSNTSIAEEWDLAIGELGLTQGECSQLLANGFAQMFLEDAPAPAGNVG